MSNLLLTSHILSNGQSYIAALCLLLSITYSCCAPTDTTSPWHSPCGDPRHAAPSHLRDELDRWIGARSVEGASEAELRDVMGDVTHKLEDIIDLVGELKNYLHSYFRGNVAHVRRLEDLPSITALSASTSLRNADIRVTLHHIYELFTRITIFTNNMKTQLHSIRNLREKADRLLQLQALEYGGTWQGLTITSGIYNIMCDIYRVLPSVLTDLREEIVPGDLSFSTDLAAAKRHNRDYYVIHNIEAVLVAVKSNLKLFSN